MSNDKIMRNLIAFTFISILLVFTSCRKDEITPLDPTFVPDDPHVEVESSFFGLVKDQEGQVLEEAKVITEVGEKMTDENGYFIVEKAPLDQDGSLVKVTKRGYHDAYRFVMPNPGTSTYIEITMIKKVSTGTVDASLNNPINLTDKTSLTLPPNSLANADGTAYNGQYEVFFHYYDPTGINFPLEIPGDQRGVSANGEEVQLVSYGMMAVDIVSSAGEPLNLREGYTATWVIDIDPTLTDLPEEVPLWSLDETTGVWHEEGMATLTNGKYVGEVSHFSFWNCDYPFPLIELSGVVVDENETPLPNVGVHITTSNGLSSGYGMTDSEGKFRGKVPKDEELKLELDIECWDAVVYDIGAFAVDTDLGSLELLNNEIVAHFNGVFLDCNSVPVQNGYVVLRYESNLLQVIPLDEMGKFEGILFACRTGNYTFKGVDISGLTESEEVVFEATELEATMDLGELSACDNEADEYYRMIVDGELVPVIDFSGNMASNAFFGASGSTQLGFTAYFEEISFLSVDYSGVTGSCIDLDACSEVTFELTSIPTATGEYLEGSATGSLDFNDGEIRDVTVEFRIKIQATWWQVRGRVWLDENENGIRDAGEPPVYDDNILISGGKISQDGTYERLTPEAEAPSLRMTLPPQYSLTQSKVGSDDSVDSDYGSNGYWSISSISEDIFNIDAGLILDSGFNSDFEFEQLPKYCDMGSGCIIVNSATNLDAEYEVEINDNFGSILYNSGVVTRYHQVCDLEPDIYEVVIRVDGQIVWDKDFIIIEDQIDILKDISLDCVGGEVEATMSVEIINNAGESIIYPFGPEWRDEFGQPEWTGPEYVAGPGTYTFTAVYQDCDESVEFVIPDRLIGIAGIVWDDNLGAFPNEGEFTEPGIDGVEIVLTDVATGMQQSVTTDSRGAYTFPNGTVTSTEFTLMIIAPAGYTLVEKGVGNSVSTISSAADPLTGETDVMYVDNNCVQITNHFGLK